MRRYLMFLLYLGHKSVYVQFFGKGGYKLMPLSVIVKWAEEKIPRHNYAIVDSIITEAEIIKKVINKQKCVS
jgi:hypothetical protein